MKNSTAVFSNKLFLLIVAVALLLVIGPVFSYIQTAFGWTDPSCDPPGCSGGLHVDSSNGNVGIKTTTASATLTVSGNISAMGNFLKDIATPVLATDGVNKAYVDAAGGGNGGTLVTLYGVSNSNYVPGARQNVSGGQQTCYIGTSGLLCNGLPGAYGVPAGAGILACSAVLGDPAWQDLYSGYGPHGALMSWFGNVGGSDPEENDYPEAVAAATYSTCSLSPDHFLPARYSTQTGGNVFLTTSALSACVRNQSGGSACNTCKVCYKP